MTSKTPGTAGGGEFDLVIRGGTVVDGSGAEPFDADVAVLNGKIVGVGKVDGKGVEEIDARGRLVTPGFVDIHTHYDGQVTWAQSLSPSSLHGTTTVLMGNCGVGFAPCKPSQRELLIKVMEGVEDIPGIVMSEGVPWQWETFPDYLDFLSGRSCDVDFATQVPHGPIRVYVMGERGADREPATAEDMARMAELVQEGVQAGALGFSTARTLNHRRKDGVLAPTITAGEEELHAIAMGLTGIGKGTLQAVDDFADTSEASSTEFQMWRRIVHASGRPLSLTVVQIHSAPETWRHLLRFMQEANAAGDVIRGQTVSRPIGVFLGLDLSSNPFMNCPSYKAIADLPLERRVAEMSKPDVRARILSEEPDSVSQLSQTRTVEDMVEFTEPLEYFPPASDKLEARAQRLGVSAMELAYDILLKSGGKSMLYHPLANYAASTPQVTHTLMRDENTLLALGDGGAHVGMICDASISTHLLTYWTQDRPGMKGVSLPWAIEALTRRPAQAVGLDDRGLVAAGYKADLNIIDFDKLKLYSPVIVQDLPAGGKRLTQRADGYAATIVNGIVTYRNGTPTGALPGKLIRGSQPDPRAVTAAAH